MDAAKRLVPLLVLALLAGIALASPSPGAEPEAPAEPGGAGPGPAVAVATVEGITEYELANGLRVLLFPDPTRPTTTVNVTYFVGSRHEGYGETGMAHLLEHLVFKGTPAHPNIADEITRRGGRANGTTWFDRTNYFQTFPAAEENLEWSLGMEADRMVNSFISAADLESEMTVVRNEWEAGENSPFAVLLKRTFGAAFQWHGYGRSTIGERSDLENVPIERLQAFYRRHYQPDNALLVVSGRFDPDHALATVERTFGAIPRPERSGELRRFETYTREPTQDGERSVTLRRVGDVQMAMAVYRVPAAAHPDFAAVDLLTHLLGDSPRGRLHRALVAPGKASSVSAFAFPLREPGALVAFAEVRTDQSVEEARDLLVATIEGLAEQPPTEEEVERARTAKLRDLRLTLNSSERVGIGLTEWAASGDWRLVFLHRDRLRAIGAEEVVRAASAYLRPSGRTVGLFVPEPEPRRAQIPEAPEIATLVAGYRGEEAGDEAAVEAAEGTIEGLEARIVRTELPAGARVALVPKSTRGGAVVATLTLRLGDEALLTGRRTDGGMTASMLLRGTRRLDRRELADAFDRLQARVSVTGQGSLVSARIETVEETLPEVLALVAEVLREPAFDEGEFEELRRERLAAVESQMAEPAARAFRAYSRHLSPRPAEHPEYTPTFEEEVAELAAAGVEGARSFHRELYGAGPGATVVLVGDFDPDAVLGVLAETLGDWAPAHPFERVPSPFDRVAATAHAIETPDKTNAVLLAGLNLEMRDDHPDYPALVLGNYMLGGGFLNSRLATRIRQRDGLSYGVFSQFSAHPIDARGSFLFFAIFAPENVERVEAAMRDEIAKALAGGFTADEVEAAKLGWSQSRQVSRGTDAQLAGLLDAGLYFGRTLEHDAELEARVAALTPEEIAEALRRHLDPKALSVVRAGDFAAQAGE